MTEAFIQDVSSSEGNAVSFSLTHHPRHRFGKIGEINITHGGSRYDAVTASVPNSDGPPTILATILPDTTTIFGHKGTKITINHSAE